VRTVELVNMVLMVDYSHVNALMVSLVYVANVSIVHTCSCATILIGSVRLLSWVRKIELQLLKLVCC